jgi:RNA polymerase sigma factor (sigma-70 family)
MTRGVSPADSPEDGTTRLPIVTKEFDAADRSTQITRLFQEHNRQLVSLLFVRLQSRDEAEEVAQEAYTRMLNWDKAVPADGLRNCLFAIARNLTIDRLRRRSIQNQYEHMLSVAPETGLNDPETQALAAQLVQYLNELRGKCAQALAMYVDDFSSEQIAVRLNISTRMANRYVSYGLAYCAKRVNGATAKEAQRRNQL